MAFAVPVAALILACNAEAAPKYKVLYSFGVSSNDANSPQAPVIIDPKGNLFGTANGGSYQEGTAYELMRTRKGWVESVLYSFGGTKDDGLGPQAGLALDALGNLYGTTVNGGAYLYGTAFELSPGSGGWSETVIHSFCGSGDGCDPYSNLIFDAAGNLYGTTYTGQVSYGTVFELSPGSGGWTETTLYGFQGGSDGRVTFAGLTWDKSGNLYGTTWEGGSYGDGTVYELTRSSGGAWTERILHSFGPSNRDGAGPTTGVVFDRSGNLYGTTAGGGPNLCGSYHNCGVVYKLSPGKHGGWKETRLYDFAQNAGGFDPQAIAIDSAGNLYGTTMEGGSGGGVVFRLAPLPHGKWKYTVLHTFSGPDGGVPMAGVTLDGKGHIYGTTFGGGAYGGGVVFELAP
jgi:uncharacterized repeat protein (TIGR03803 family)